jgi:hypothetical protein
MSTAQDLDYIHVLNKFGQAFGLTWTPILSLSLSLSHERCHYTEVCIPVYFLRMPTGCNDISATTEIPISELGRAVSFSFCSFIPFSFLSPVCYSNVWSLFVPFSLLYDSLLKSSLLHRTVICTSTLQICRQTASTLRLQ